MTEIEHRLDLPPPEPSLTIVGMLLLELEWEFPGLVERMVERLQSAAVRRAVIRLRPPPQAEQIAAVQDASLAWLEATSVLTAALYPRRSKHAKRKRA